MTKFYNKIQLIDLVVKGHGNSDLIIIRDTPTSPNTYKYSGFYFQIH